MSSKNSLELTPRFLSLEDVLDTHEEQIEDFGGTSGIKDKELLLSAIAQPSATFGGKFLHHTLFEMAAAYLFHIVLNHPFVDGNKRTGLMCALSFLELNKVSAPIPNQQLLDLTFAVAQHQLTKAEIALQFQHEVVTL